MKALITGAGGFIGKHLVVDQLKRGRQVTAVDIRVGSLESLSADRRLSIIQADFSDRDRIDPLLNGHDICLHLASAHLETGVADQHFWHVNVDQTLEFVKRCHLAGIPRFIHCSTVGVYGNIKNPPADENSACHPDVAYEKSKLAGERAVREYAQGNNYDVVVLRPAWVYGPGCDRTVRLFRTIKKGRFFYVGDGQTLRHPIYIEDMIEGIEAAATKEEAAGEVFIIAGPRAVTIEELVEAIADSLSVAPPKLRVPKVLVWPAVFVFEIAAKVLSRNAPFTRRSLKFFLGNTAFTSEKAWKMLGYRATVELPEGVLRTHEQLSAAGLL